ncbi:hypothetical protein [Maridesulfovibrio sp.]
MDMTLCEKYLITNEGSEHLSPKDVFMQVLNEEDKDVRAAYAAVAA